MGERRRGHRRASEEGHGNAVVHLLVDQQTERPAACEVAKGFAGAPCALGEHLRVRTGAAPAFRLDDAVDPRVRCRPVEAGHREAEGGGDREDQFPVADVSGEEQCRTAASSQRIHVFLAFDLPATAAAGALVEAEMGQLGRGASKVVPHRPDHGRASGVVEIGKVLPEVPIGNPGRRETRPDVPCDRASDRRRQARPGKPEQT